MSAEHKKPKPAAKIIVSEDGPYIVSGAILLFRQIVLTVFASDVVGAI
ncbi:MAG: hypothetical protein ACM3ZT_03455 [Bacillota bacterium]